MERVKSCVEDLRNMLEDSPMTERKSFIKSFVREVRVARSEVLLSYVPPLLAGMTSQETILVPPIVTMVGDTGFEPVTSAMSTQCSNQLS